MNRFLLPPPLIFLCFFWAASLSAARAGQTGIEGPSGSGQFGTAAVILPNGNTVVTDPYFDAGGVADAGAVHLFSPDRVLISTLSGGSAEDRVGNGGVVVLANGNYVVRSYRWDNGAVRDAGAVTWCSGTTGVNGVVSPENSLVGSGNEDRVGSAADSTDGGVTALANGNYVVRSPDWRNGTASGRFGAVTWGNGATGASGVISAANSLVGASPGDRVGTSASGGGVTPLRSGDYVVSCPLWRNGSWQNAGAVIWCPGASGRTGLISAENALTGGATGDFVGGGLSRQNVVELAGGAYVVCSPSWAGGGIPQAGAVTWCPAGGGMTGPVSAANSLTGSKAQDCVGGSNNNGISGGVTALSDGNYAVFSPLWDNGEVLNTGAVTWSSGAAGLTGRVSAANSLTGAAESDHAGNRGVFALPGGHYVVCSAAWNRNAGAVTRITGGGSFSGSVTAANSLTGSRTGDSVGLHGITVLSSGHYVVCSPAWDNEGASDAGAVTWCDGATGLAGAVSAVNSLVGAAQEDRVGSGTLSTLRNGVVALTNGNYVVASPRWDNGPVTDAGAVTWCPGAAGRTGLVTAANSLTGSGANDSVGGAIAALSDQVTGREGGVTALANGNYVVSSPFWDNGAVADVGAVTWGNGAAGLAGPVTPANSLTGSWTTDAAGSGGITALAGGDYAVFTPGWWDNSGQYQMRKAGAVTLGDGKTGTTGVINKANSVTGPSSGGGADLNLRANDAGTVLIVGVWRANRVVLVSPEIINRAEISVERPQSVKLDPGGGADFGPVGTDGSRAIHFTVRNSGFAPLSAGAVIVEGPAFSVATPPAADVPPGELTSLIVLFKPSVTGPHSGVLRLTALETDNSPFEIKLTGTGVTGGPARINDMAAPPGSGRFGYTVTVLASGNLVVTDPYFDLPGPVKDAGAAYLYSPGGALLSTLTGTSAYDRVGMDGVTVLKNGNYLIQSPYWNNGAAVIAGAVTWADASAGVSGMVSAANSLVGSTAYDALGAANFTIERPNRLVTPLENGNYVVCSPLWDNGALVDAGAVTWCDGAAGSTGPITTANSLTGGAAGDLTGTGGATALKNGNYAVCSPYWLENRGAVTWGSGTAGVSGAISPENSLTGAAPYDYIGRFEDSYGGRFSGVFALSNGNYVVCSPSASSAGVSLAGAVTWCDGSAGRAGVVPPADSLTGLRFNDRVGSGGVTALTSGNYVVCSPGWSLGTAERAGAVTWGDGGKGVTGPVSQINSLTGAVADEHLGLGGVTALTNGNYAVKSYGAVTWGNGAGGLRGPLAAAESLTGHGGGTMFRGSGSVTALANGNYVVSSPDWQGRGAVTWRPGDTAAGAAVSPQNSLVGPDFTSDYIGSSGVTALANGNYVVSSPLWADGFANSAQGAVTWRGGASASAGELTAGNSLTGSSRYDWVGGNDPGSTLGPGGITALTNGNYLVTSPRWANGQLKDAGAITWGNGAAGVQGPVSAANSITGTAAGDLIGGEVEVFAGGYYAVHSRRRANGAAAQAGVITLGTGAGPAAGPLSRDNSVFGEAPNGGFDLNAAFRVSDRTFIAACPRDNIITFFRYHAGPAGSAVVLNGPGGEELASGGGSDFGEVETGKSRSVVFTLKNTGDSALTLSSVTTDSTQFAVTAAPPAGTLAPGESADFSVQFSPSSTGAKSAALRLLAGQPAAELFGLNLTGTGKAAPSGNPFGDSGIAPQVARLPDGGISTSFKAAAGKTYLLQRSTDLILWSEGISVTAGPEGDILWTEENPLPEKTFYRLRVE